MSEVQRILIVDDDQEICSLVADFLREHSFIVHTAHNGKEMQRALTEHIFHLVVLDVMLPGDDGFTLCRQIRSNSEMPVIMLTAVDTDTDKIVGLEMGADDYLAKPFNPRELLARVKAILRRTAPASQKENGKPRFLTFDTWRLDIDKRCLLNDDDMEIALSTGEYDLLLVLVQHPKKLLSRDQLLEQTKNRPAGPFDRSIDMQISRLRQKIEEDAKNPQIIKTVRGGGYIFTSGVKEEFV